jgi:hypothetical protein
VKVFLRNRLLVMRQASHCQRKELPISQVKGYNELHGELELQVFVETHEFYYKYVNGYIDIDMCMSALLYKQSFV